MGVPISASVNEDRTTRKLSLQDLYPLRPARKRDSEQGRWGWVSLISAAVNNTGMEKISLQDPRRRGTELRQKDDGVGLTARRRWISTVQRKRRSANRKNSRSRTYTPRGWRGNGTPTEDDGGGSMSMSAPKKLSLQDLYPLSLHDIYPPRAGTHRSISSKTVGVGLTISAAAEKTSIEKNSGCRTYTPRDAVPHPFWPWATIFQSLRAT
jgi:hypothetical protein